MNRIRLGIALSLSLGCSLTGCTDLDETTTTSSHAQALGAECTGGVKFDGTWPTIGKWTGKAPPPISDNQYFVIAALDPQDKEFIVVQADWENGKIPWAIKISREERAAIAAALAPQVGSLETLNGIRIPPGRPPGDLEGQWVIDRGYRSNIPD